MRALINIPEQQLKVLSAICAARKLSRAEAVRQAIEAYIEQHRPLSASAFGVWRDQDAQLPGAAEPLPKDGLAYQERMRSEW